MQVGRRVLSACLEPWEQAGNKAGNRQTKQTKQTRPSQTGSVRPRGTYPSPLAPKKFTAFGAIACTSTYTIIILGPVNFCQACFCLCPSLSPFCISALELSVSALPFDSWTGFAIERVSVDFCFFLATLSSVAAGSPSFLSLSSSLAFVFISILSSGSTRQPRPTSLDRRLLFHGGSGSVAHRPGDLQIPYRSTSPGVCLSLSLSVQSVCACATCDLRPACAGGCACVPSPTRFINLTSCPTNPR